MLRCAGAPLVLRAALTLLWHAYQARLVRRLPVSGPAFLVATGALKAYDKAIEIRQKAAAAAKAGSAEDGSAEAGQLSARLLNNAAVLHLRSGDAQKAYDLMAQALAAAAGGAATDLDPLSQVKGPRRRLRRGRQEEWHARVVLAFPRMRPHIDIHSVFERRSPWATTWHVSRRRAETSRWVVGVVE